MSQATPALIAPARGRNACPYPAGTRIEADNGLGLFIAGTLVEDCDFLDGVVAFRDEDEGDTIHINGWLWSIEVIGEGTIHA